MPKPGKSAAGKGSAKAGYMMPNSKQAASAGGGKPPKTTVGIIKSPKRGK